MPDLRARLRLALTRRATRIVRDELAGRRADLAAAEASLAVTAASVLDVERRAALLAARLDRSPLSADTTVHAAHARHPGVAALFAARGLPACPACAVGADETLAEAAQGEGFDLDELLDAMRRLVAEG